MLIDFLFILIKSFILTILLILYLSLPGYLKTHEYKNNKILKCDLSDFRTFDIISISYKPNYPMIISQGYSKMRFTHPVIILEHEKELKVIELMSYSFNPDDYYEYGKTRKKINNKLHLIPLDLWFKINKKHYMMRFRINDIYKLYTKEYLDKYLIDYYHRVDNVKVDTNSIYKYLKTKFYDSDFNGIKNNEKYLCYEVICNILIELKILNKNNITPDLEFIKLNQNLKIQSDILDFKNIINY